ncbi:FtsK/SpoIIIE domain-containing protein [Allokutzneria sp. A3M-2-11 16]|uniref:FtsK/SpoIIIE domain-containing protein n=1 Tax=Allokutzneria sp. A3M-2-11 16 TaxID=2962043 RepID=UPI0020B709B6|nr:FtsK/SpoIIIE domain-containing protein [Allokutzneria sp. A3M-2-11 16]MCP3803890.1 FtsK/SpoIIIE domain-containing protein [Allokutzneria sp. A3M-2-11 16]
MKTPENNRAVNGDVNACNGLVRKVFDAEFVSGSRAPEPRASAQRPLVRYLSRAAWMWLAAQWRRAVAAVSTSDTVRHAWSVAVYRVRKAPVDAVRLVWFTVRGVWRWTAKAWTWFTYGDLRADARTARVAGDAEARRQAQELIRADAQARWARLGLVLTRGLTTAAVLAVLGGLLWLIDSFLDRADMWDWLATVYEVIDAFVLITATVGPWLAFAGLVGVLVAATVEGRDTSPGAGWLVRPDRDDADSWVDERMVSKALAHLGIAPLAQFFKTGGQLHYTIAARKDGDGTAMQIRLPAVGVTADHVADRRDRLAANIGRATLEVWPTMGDEACILDLWIADKGALSSGAGEWPLQHDGTVDVFDGVPFGLSQRGAVINAPLIGANWLVGGRPGQGKSAALRTLLLGAALDPTAELWVFVMGESPDFDPFAPRLTRYRMGMDDTVAEAAVQALSDLVEEMERRGKVLGEQPGRPPKVSRKLADRRSLGLHPLIIAIDECHELFQHEKYGKQAAVLAVRLVKRGRKYGIVLLLATQSPTKDSIPREITRNVMCGAAFSVADQVANDGLLGSGKYKAGIRATELRMGKDRGTAVAVGLTDNVFELVRGFYIPFEDGTDMVSPVIARALSAIEHTGREITASSRPVIEAAPVDHLADIAAVLDGDTRARTQTVLSRLAARNPDVYGTWGFSDLKAEMGTHGERPRKIRGHMYVIAEEVARAITRRDSDTSAQTQGEAAGEARGSGGVLPTRLPQQTPPPDQAKHSRGRRNQRNRSSTENPGKPGDPAPSPGTLPQPGGGADDS